VDADHHDITLVLIFDLPQLRKNVDAVYSAIRPEVEKHDFAPKTRERDAVAASVNPIETSWKLRRANAGKIG
jgi:hypothetical protein